MELEAELNLVKIKGIFLDVPLEIQRDKMAGFSINRENLKAIILVRLSVSLPL